MSNDNLKTWPVEIYLHGRPEYPVPDKTPKFNGYAKSGISHKDLVDDSDVKYIRADLVEMTVDRAKEICYGLGVIYAIKKRDDGTLVVSISGNLDAEQLRAIVRLLDEWEHKQIEG